MLKTLCSLVALLLISFVATAQVCTTCRYVSEVFDEVTIDTVHFGEGVNAEGNTQQLYMDVYTPVGDTATNRPVLVFAFGGGFIQGDRFEKHVTKTCERFAKSGYVAVAIDYRIGIDLLYGLQGPNREALRVFYRAMQDMRAAVQYMKYSADSLGNPYNINPNMVFVGGASSGGITALMSTYGDKSVEMLDVADTVAMDALGGFGSTSANGPHAAYNWDVVGVVSIAGALPSVTWIEPNDPPVLLAHGDADDTVPYKDEATLNSFLQFASVTLLGSYIVDTAATGQGLCSYLFTMVGEDHPSNGKSDYYFENVYSRIMPRMKAIIEGKSYCCTHSVTINGDTLQSISEVGDTLNLTATLANDLGTTTTQWCSMPCAEEGTTLSVTTQPAPDPIQYYQVIVEEAGCVTTDMVAVQVAEDTVIIGIAPSMTADMNLYPNPTEGQLHIESSYAVDALFIQSISGRVIYREENIAGTHLQADISHLPVGTYVVSLVKDGMPVARQRLVVAR